MQRITDQACLRQHHEVLARMLDAEPWTRERAESERARLLREADALTEQAEAVHTPLPPATRAERAAVPPEAYATAVADAYAARDQFQREARALRDQADAIPRSDYVRAYIRWMLDHMADVTCYAWLIEHPSDRAGAGAAAERVRHKVTNART